MHNTPVLFVTLFALLSCQFAQAGNQAAKNEDPRIAITRVFIEKARQAGRQNPLGTPDDGYQAIKDMVWQLSKRPDLDSEKHADLERLKWILDFAQGCAELERNASMAGKEIKFDLSMGTKEGGTEGLVIVRFLYPEGTLPPGISLKGFEWQLSWKNVSTDPQKERWQLERVKRQPILNSPGHTAGASHTLQ